MKIQINTDHTIQSNETLIDKYSSIIENALSRVSDHITQVEVHLSDENGNKRGKDEKRCMIEAHLEGKKPIVVTDNAATLNQALDGAIEKLLNMIESILGRQHDQRIGKTQEPTRGPHSLEDK
jgi:ribosome-associated translation inhibitor RaiA